LGGIRQQGPVAYLGDAQGPQDEAQLAHPTPPHEPQPWPPKILFVAQLKFLAAQPAPNPTRLIAKV
jgi:hypothetical protein